MARHFHRNDRVLLVGDRTFFGVSESSTGLMVSPDGFFVTKTKTDGTYKGYLCGGGYLQVSVGKRNELAHRVVFEVCSGTEIPDDLELDHIDTDRTNNALSNLRIVTRHENTVANLITAARHTVSLAAARAAKKDPEVRRRMSEKFKKSLGRPVVGTCVATGEVKEFDSIQSAVEFLGRATLYNSVMYCCRHTHGVKQAQGWKFEYKEEK